MEDEDESIEVFASGPFLEDQGDSQPGGERDEEEAARPGEGEPFAAQGRESRPPGAFPPPRLWRSSARYA